MPKVLINGELVDVPAEALFADDGTTPFGTPAQPQQVAPPAPNPSEIEQVRAEAQQVQQLLQQQQEQVTARLEEIAQQVGGLTAAEQREQERLRQEQERLEAEERAAREAEMDPVALIHAKEQEWKSLLDNTTAQFESRLSESEQKRAEAEALAQKEREFADLREYISAQVEANKDEIAPQFLPYISGNSREEVDAAIAQAKQGTSEILTEMQQALGQGQQPDPNAVVVPGQPQAPAPPQQQFITRSTAGPGNFDPTGLGQQTLSPEQIANMPMNEYANLRRSMGIGGQGQNRGLFG